MQLTQLRYFQAIAESGGFTRAARKMRVGQPTLSIQILKLEHELGVKLFSRRGGENAILTDLGRAFLPGVERVLREAQDAVREMQRLGRSPKKKVLLGATATIAPYFLLRPLGMFAKDHPDVEVVVIEESSLALLERLRSAQLDFALLPMPIPISCPGLTCSELLREPFYVAMPDSHPLANKSHIPIQAIKTEPLLLVNGEHCSPHTPAGVHLARRRCPRVAFEGSYFASILAMVASGLGLSIVPEMAAEKRPGCAYVRLAGPQGHRTIGFARMKGRALPPAARALMDHLRTSANESQFGLAQAQPA